MSLVVNLTAPFFDEVLLDTITVHPFVICEAIVDYLWPINYLVHALLLSDALACTSML